MGEEFSIYQNGIKNISIRFEEIDCEFRHIARCLFFYNERRYKKVILIVGSRNAKRIEVNFSMDLDK